MKVIILIITVLSVSLSLFAQDNKEENNKEENKYNDTIMYSNITEFGIAAASPRSIAFEGTTVHGISLHKQHHLGIGIGIGFTFCSYTYNYGGYSSIHSYSSGYTPVFVNYRFYFFPDRKRSPHVNVSLGGLVVEDGGGFYYSITMGYKNGKFSFSSGVSLFQVCREETVWQYYDPIITYPDPYDPYYTVYRSPDPDHYLKKSWYFPFGISLKFGFTF